MPTPTPPTNPTALRSQALIAIVLAILAAAIVVAPVAAAPIEDYGSALGCRYRTIEGTSPATADLKRIVVTPPTMFADEDSQTLGWRLIVRHIRSRYQDDSFKVTTWKSKIRTAVAYQGQAAEFSPIVYSPPDLSASSGWDKDKFRTYLKLIWYTQDGSVQRSVLHEFWTQYAYLDGELWHHSGDPSCSGTRQLEFDGGPM